MGSACCRCVQPASVQPRKTYNTLVTQLFPAEPIKTDEPIDSTMRRKIQKLQEYLQANPAKVPKASRRLMRRIKATLRKPGDNLGHVKVAVHTYAYLLAKTADETSSYGPTFFLKELLTGPDAVVPLLLRDIHIEMRTLGAELLAVFTGVQSPVDSKLDAIQAHVPQVCRVAQAALRSDRKEQKLQETAERRRAGDKLAVPDPIYLIGRRDPAHVAALEVGCLRCLREVVVLCRKNKVVPAQIHEIQAVMLDNLHASRGGAGAFGSREVSAAGLVEQPAAATTAGAAAAPQGVVDTAFYSAMGMQQFVSSGSHPRELAEQLLQQMASFTQDIAMVDKILDSFYEYMDDRDRWQEQRVVQNFLAALGASGGQHHYSIFVSLLRHASSRKLAVGDCSAVLRVAKEQGERLDENYSLTALHLALEELPKAWADQARRDPKLMMHFKPFLDLLRAGTAAMKDMAHPGDSPAHGQRSVTGTPRAALSSGQAGTPTVPDSSSPPAAAAAGGPADASFTLQQELGALKVTMLQMVQALAAKVQTTGELSEVITGALQSVAASLHLQRYSVPWTVSAAGAAAAANGPSELPVSPFQVAAAGPSAAAQVVGPSGSRDAQLAGGPAGTAKLASAAVALELAAAAAESHVQDKAFVTPPSSFGGSTGLTRSEPAVMLPGGVVPAQLVSASLPILLHGAPALRPTVHRILLALLPAAPQGMAEGQQASQLAEAALLELKHLRQGPASPEDAAHDESSACATVAGVDALLRCSLRGQQPWPSAVLSVSRAVLQQQGQWAEQGYRSSAGGSPVKAHAVLLLFNSQLAALAGATGTASLVSHQLPLDPQGHSLLQLTANGLMAAGGHTAAAVAASTAALQALEKQHPPSHQHVEALRATLSEMPLLVAEHGEALPTVLDPAQPLRVSTTASDGDRRDKQQLSSKVVPLLTKRMTTFSRDLLHVSDLLKRDSMTRSQHMPSVSTVMDGSSSSGGALVQTAPAVGQSAGAAATAVTPGVAAAPNGLPGVAVVASGGQQGADSRAAAAAAVSVKDVQVAVPGALAGTGTPATLSSAVAAVLKQPAPAGAYVVRDIKISKLAGELDSQL